MLHVAASWHESVLCFKCPSVASVVTCLLEVL
jgi:hypothetical protein